MRFEYISSKVPPLCWEGVRCRQANDLPFNYVTTFVAAMLRLCPS
jgi:hypothetical protein